MNTLKSIVQPLQVDDFLKRFFDRRAVHIEGAHDKFVHLFGWDALNRVLNSTKHPHPTLKLTREGKTFKPRNVQAAVTEAAKGATVIVDDIDCYDPTLARFMDSLNEEIPDYSRINAYLSYPNAPGFDLHYDTQDFFILQIEGFKRWQVFGTTVESPLFQQKHHGLTPPPKESLYLDCILKPGDVLYCPRGHWHVALAEKEPSLHLTLGIFLATGIDFMTWLIDELRENIAFRRSLPLQQMERSDQPAERVKCLKNILLKKLSDPEVLDQFETYKVANARRRLSFNFPHHMIASITQYKAVRGFRRPHLALRLRSIRETNKMELICDGRILEFDRRAEGVLSVVVGNHEITREMLVSASELTWEQILGVLVPLVRHGILEPLMPQETPQMATGKDDGGDH